MDRKHRLATLVLALSIGALAWAAPDEEKLGKSLGYPIAKIGNNKDWYYDESVRVGSFTHQAEIPGLYQGKANLTLSLVHVNKPNDVSAGQKPRCPSFDSHRTTGRAEAEAIGLVPGALTLNSARQPLVTQMPFSS